MDKLEKVIPELKTFKDFLCNECSDEECEDLGTTVETVEDTITSLDQVMDGIINHEEDEDGGHTFESEFDVASNIFYKSRSIVWENLDWL